MSENNVTIEWEAAYWSDKEEREKFRRQAALRIFTERTVSDGEGGLTDISPKHAVQLAGELIRALEKHHERI